MCQIWLRSDGRVEKKGGYRQADRQTNISAALYSRWSEENMAEAGLAIDVDGEHYRSIVKGECMT